MSVTVEQITAVGQSILNEITAMPAEQRRVNTLVDFFVARFNAMPESEIKSVLLDVLPSHVEQLNLITQGSLNERMTNDEFYVAMNAGVINWGDLCLEAPSPAFVEDKVEYKSHALDFGWDLEIPQLKLRKDIWENFPVIVEALGTGADGAERHAIRIHRKNWSEWREEMAENFDDYLNWDCNTEFRLSKALESCRFWTVEESDDPNTFAVIRMNFVPRSEFASVSVSAPPTGPVSVSAPLPMEHMNGWTVVPACTPATPMLMRINDITTIFPTCWNNETTPRSSARRGDIISISIHGTKLRSSGMDSKKVERDLMAGLRASSAWRVLAPAAGSREFCRLHMA